jgi:hypothetical protein
MPAVLPLNKLDAKATGLKYCLWREAFGKLQFAVSDQIIGAITV